MISYSILDVLWSGKSKEVSFLLLLHEHVGEGIGYCFCGERILIAFFLLRSVLVAISVPN